MDIFEENCDTENNCTVSYFWKGLALFLLGVIIGLFVNFDDDEDGFDHDGVKF